MNLDREDVEAIAVRTAEILEARGVVAPPSVELVDAEEVARRFGVKAAWVRRHADLLGVTRLGDGPRARLRFDPVRVAAALSRRSDGERSERPGFEPMSGLPPVRRRRRAGRSASRVSR